MITEIKRTSLIPSLNQTAEEARDSHYGGNFPPKTAGDLPGYNPSPIAVVESRQQTEAVRSTRSRERGLLFRKVAPYLGVLVAAATLTGAFVYNKLTQPGNRAVDIVVQPYDNPSTVAQRAEDRFGKDAGDFNVHNEALRLSDKYGVLHAGQHLEVTVK